MEERAPRDDADDEDVSVERFGRSRGADLRAGTWGGRSDLQSGDRAYGHQVASRRMAAAHYPTPGRLAGGDRGRDRVGRGRVAVGRRGEAARTGVCRAPRPQRPPLGANRSPPLPRRSRHRPSGRAVRSAGAEHHREDSGDVSRHRGHRSGDGTGHHDQRDRLLHPAAVRRGRRGDRARADPTRRRWATTCRRWDRSARSWSAGSTIG